MKTRSLLSCAMLFSGIALLLCPNAGQAQDATRFEKQVNKLVSKKRTLDPAKKLVVFTGSSSIRRWTTLETDFPKYNVLNYGFGGSQFSDLTFYYDKLVLKPAPDILFIYEGDNDIATGKDPQSVFQQAQLLIERIRQDLPQARIILISPKPCLKNWDKRKQYLELNTKLASYCANHTQLDYLDMWALMVDKEGIVFQDIFIADGDHMKPEGYEIWIKAVREVLK